MRNDKKPIQQDEAAKRDPAYEAAYDHQRGLYDERDRLLAMSHKGEKTLKRLGEIADELMELEKPTLLIPAIRGLCGHSTMNRPAREEEQARLKMRRDEGRYTLEEAALEVSEAGEGADADDMLKKLIKSALDQSLPVYRPGKRTRYLYGDGFASRARESYEEAYWNDLNSWLAKNEPLIDFKFPAPSGTPEAAAPSLTTVKAAISAPGVARAAVQRTRTDGLATAMGAGLIAYRIKYRIDPTARALFDWLVTNDETGKIEDFNSDTDVITWKRSDGGLSDTSFKSFQGRFTSMKK